MYAVSVSRTFVAQHYLTVPNPGPEGTLHSHQYTVEATFRGPDLDEYGYLVDIDAVIDALEAVVDSLRDRTLNELPALEGRNPSAERLARTVGDRLLERLEPATATELVIRIDEDDIATVNHERPL
ncbi:6-pyruvoyl trahydropterin synthase family protein [Natrarchaeobaculum sulfurireducens]|uniref:6-pyruvoyl-tetrahydropterin synthase n=1 Tax=Natrarchaeobaculum sulfurireducens TaxID=2044521 RepID=A0A346PLR7_9EURY|nr:6-carboxytetrahydropterin synthase [Natrarchaeobaculum sulfurireducens]AXR76792.1 6-pyruvoyl-tetrahydropterin synthase [Natrarchaeobaculum sulfurireducens]AXR80462.1 PTPS-like type 4 [Natrarchaeobaculum sulfurireducens]